MRLVDCMKDNPLDFLGKVECISSNASEGGEGTEKYA